MSKVFTYIISPLSVDSLTSEIRLSGISIVLDYITAFGDNVDIYFKTDLPDADKLILDSIVSSHLGIPTPSELNQALMTSEQQNDYLPTPRAYKIGNRIAKTDGAGNLVTRGQSFTDEGSFRDNFFGNSLFSTLTGTFEFNSESDVVLSNDADLSEMKTLFPYVKLSTDSDDKFTQGNLVSSNSFGLFSNYKGTTGTGTAISSNWLPDIVGDISLVVVDSWLTITSSTSNSSTTLEKFMDYLPLRISFKVNISKRLSGQVISFGVHESSGSRAGVQISSTDETKVSFVTSCNDSEMETQITQVSMPRGGKTNRDHIFTIEVTNGQCSLLVDEVLVVTHKDKIPDAYDPLSLCMRVENGTISSTNIVKIDWVHFQSLDQVDIANTFSNTPVKTDTVCPKSVDGKPMMTTSPRPIGTYTYLSSRGDDSSAQSNVGGSPISIDFHHAVGDENTHTKSEYFDINAIINETHINKAVVQWTGCKNDHIRGEIVPQVTTVTDQAGGNYTVVGGCVFPTAPGAGNKNVDLATAKLVEMVPNEFGVTPPGYWNATYNTTTQLFENITFDASGYGQFNIFAVEAIFFRFIPCFTMLGDNMIYEIPSDDTSRLGQNTRVKITFITIGADHEWWSNAAIRLYRRKTV